MARAAAAAAAAEDQEANAVAAEDAEVAECCRDWNFHHGMFFILL
jgi:hypothetical protein